MECFSTSSVTFYHGSDAQHPVTAVTPVVGVDAALTASGVPRLMLQELAGTVVSIRPAFDLAERVTDEHVAFALRLAEAAETYYALMLSCYEHDQDMDHNCDDLCPLPVKEAA